MCRRVCLILELLRHEHSGILCRHTVSGLYAFIDTFPNIPGVVYQNHLCAVMLYEKTSLLAYRIRHDDDRLIPLHCPDKGKPDSLIAAG